MKQAKIVFIGGGNMAHALVSGLMQDNYPKKNVWIIDPNQDKLDFFTQTYQVNTALDFTTEHTEGDIIVLAIKPQHFNTLSVALKQYISANKPIVISIAAGISLISLADALGEKTPIIRAMPNSPALIQSGITGLMANSHINDNQKSLAEHLLRGVGLVIWVQDEAQIDVITAVSGSGPAYYFLFMEMMKVFAVEHGIEENDAKLLAIQSAFGAAKMALESADDLAILRQKVTSKGGCTQATVDCFLNEGIQQLFDNGLNANIDRSKLLAEQFAMQIKLADDNAKGE